VQVLVEDIILFPGTARFFSVLGTDERGSLKGGSEAAAGGRVGVLKKGGMGGGREGGRNK
jgi:hypothetical protein